MTAQTDRRIDPRRITAYLHTAIKSFIEALEESPDRAVLTLEVLPHAERRRVIELFNKTQVIYPHSKTIQEMFEEQVERTPHELAVVHGEQHLTYRQLNCRANQLARYLVKSGVGPECFVGLCVERDIEMVIGILGILKAGGAYVPLDPNYPAARLDYMLHDTAPKALVVQRHLKGRLPPTSIDVVSLDEDWDQIAQQAATNLPIQDRGVTSSNLAYVIYTSGSTGRPKGVAIEHRNAVNLINWARSEMPWEVFDQTLHSTSLNFDLSVYECFVPLTTGGRLRVAQNALALLTEGAGVTLVNTVPSAIRAILDGGSIPESTRVVNLAGEPLKQGLVERIFAESTVERVCNLYGPSETTTYSTWIEMPREEGFNPTIGRPIANTQIYLLDKHLQPVPIGVVGEIYIGGAGVARGYLNRPELTQERFLADPFSSDSLARMYKTGDIGRWRTDGTIDYLGRNDHQVKIRGFRVELGEIEARLAQHPQVKEAVVIAREDSPGEKRLVAYLTSQDEYIRDVEALRTHLRDTLPEYMVPSAFVALQKLPLTPNGKLDRNALPIPELEAYITRQYEAPQGEVEEILTGIWQSLLNVERVGRNDNFFELGGHSLLIVQLMERLRKLGLSAQLRTVFESQTLADLAATITEDATEQVQVPPNLIPPDCTEITPQMLPLVQLNETHIRRIADFVPGGAKNIQDIYPLAPLQAGILFHHLLDERKGDTYILSTALAVSSRERLECLVSALQMVIDRHDILRTAVLWEELPEAVQVVYRRARLPLQVVALDSDRDIDQQIREWLAPGSQRLDLKQAPLVRLQVTDKPINGQWYAFLQMHHITIDHVTLEHVVSEIVAYLRGEELGSSRSASYRDHVARALVYSSTHGTEDFFGNKLGDVDEPTAPFGLLDVYGDGSDIDEARDNLEQELACRVRTQARRLGVSAATLFHAAWALVVAHTSGRDDVVFGSVLLGRLHASSSQRALGMFVNTLPVRLRLQEISARKLIEQTQQELVDLLGHEQAPLAAAQRCSAIEGSAPLFTALLNYRHSVPHEGSTWSSADGFKAVAGQERTNYPITMSVDDLGDGFRLKAQTDRRVDPRRVTSYLRTAMSSLLAALENTPHKPALELAVVPESERIEILRSFNATRTSYADGATIHELFEEQVVRTSNITAVVHDGRALSYTDLNRKANQLARYLRNQGVGTNDIVGVCMERRPEMIVAVLGILKAGAGYMPLDPSYPAERIEYMLKDASPRVLLTQQALAPVLPQGLAELVSLDIQLTKIDDYVSDNLPIAELGLSPEHLVYVIYTSGSTGRPKGTVMTHGSMVNLIEWHCRELPLAAETRVLQFAALGFDVAFQEMFSTLCAGGTLVLLDEWVRRDVEALLELLRTQSVERLFMPPMMLQSLAEHVATSGAVGLRLKDVIAAGEQLRITEDVVSLLRETRGCRLHNHYGPTETHVVTALTLSGDPNKWPSLPSIGSPIANSQIYILDERRQPVPLGVIGEIHIGGAGVASGYLNRPDLSERRFLPDPFSEDARARMYRTGDLGRWRSDGTIEYLGRNDDQVKIRGFRIELGEVEAQLSKHPAVREAAVIAREDASRQKRLVAYVTPATPDGISVDDLRAFAKRMLPEYMTPTAFVTLQNLPLTPSGKLNRRALPEPEVGAYASHQYEAPQGEIEEELADIWKKVLNVERIGRRDNFFDLGGHSLTVLSMLSKANRFANTKLRAIDIYQNPTIQMLAGRARDGKTDAGFIDLSREAVLASDVVAVPGVCGHSPRAILLTGATGFIGRFLLSQLVQSSEAIIYCLVRARSDDDAQLRLKSALVKWDLWREEFEGRLVAIHGDMRAPLLGTDERTYRMLAGEVDAIYHCATSMNHLETYAMAKQANVEGARELLKLATLRRPKIINYVSTFGVFSPAAAGSPRLVNETTSIDYERHLTSNGYVGSKWVSEKLFMTASERGIPCNIFRVGLVWGDSQHGRYDELQRGYRIIKTCLLAGVGIENYQERLAPTPVDFVARAIAYLAKRHSSGGGVFHVASSRQSNEGLFERYNRITDAGLDLVPYYDWIREVRRLHLEGFSLPIVPLIEYAFSMDEKSFYEHQNRARSVDMTFDCSRTEQELEEAGIFAPVFDDDLLARQIQDMCSRDDSLQLKIRCDIENGYTRAQAQETAPRHFGLR
jgi:amino acid adenylation domain-containing protein/thioester reductase-like protein